MINPVIELVFASAGRKEAYHISASAENSAFAAELTAGEQGFSLRITPQKELTLISAAAALPFAFAEDDALFLNGYQSWTACRERSSGERDNSLRYFPRILSRRYGLSKYGDRDFYGAEKRLLPHGYTYAYIRRGAEYAFFGGLNERDGYTQIEFDISGKRVLLRRDCGGIHYNAPFTLFDVFCLSGSEDAVFDGYFSALGTKKPKAWNAVGYTSWYNYYQNINEKLLLHDLKGLDTLPVKPDFFQIDDGYEPFVGDWLKADADKFPHGTAYVSGKIREAGYMPGIWLAPFVCEKRSELYRTHPEWLLRDGDGKPVFAGGNWSGAYALDFYNPEVRRYLTEVFAKYRAEGYLLFKLDFLYAAAMLPQHNKSRGTVMHEAMDFLRESLPDCLILGCGVPLCAAFGRVDYCRIGPDMTLSKDGAAYMRGAHAERPSAANSVKNTVYRRQLNGRAFMCDPDVFLLRRNNISLTESEKERIAYVNGLCGGLLFASDDFSEYGEKEKQIFFRAAELHKADGITAHQSGADTVVGYSIGGEKQTLVLL